MMILSLWSGGWEHITGTWVPWLVKSVEQTIFVHRINIVLRNISPTDCLNRL